jgi:hypothetical protein
LIETALAGASKSIRRTLSSGARADAKDMDAHFCSTIPFRSP